MCVEECGRHGTYFSGTDDSGSIGLGIISTGPTTGLMTPDQLHTHTQTETEQSHIIIQNLSAPQHSLTHRGLSQPAPGRLQAGTVSKRRRRMPLRQQTVLQPHSVAHSL